MLNSALKCASILVASQVHDFVNGMPATFYGAHRPAYPQAMPPRLECLTCVLMEGRRKMVRREACQFCGLRKRKSQRPVLCHPALKAKQALMTSREDKLIRTGLEIFQCAAHP